MNIRIVVSILISIFAYNIIVTHPVIGTILLLIVGVLTYSIKHMTLKEYVKYLFKILAGAYIIEILFFSAIRVLIIIIIALIIIRYFWY